MKENYGGSCRGAWRSEWGSFRGLGVVGVVGVFEVGVRFRKLDYSLCFFFEVFEYRCGSSFSGVSRGGSCGDVAVMREGSSDLRSGRGESRSMYLVVDLKI